MSANGKEKPKPITSPKPHTAGREGRLRIARSMRHAGHYHQAIHLLSDFLVDGSEDADARAAAEELAAIAQDCERRGFVYTAFVLYRQLERLQ